MVSGGLNSLCSKYSD